MVLVNFKNLILSLLIFFFFVGSSPVKAMAVVAVFCFFRIYD